MESGQIGPLRPLGCLAHIKGFAQRMALAMLISTPAVPRNYKRTLDMP